MCQWKKVKSKWKINECLTWKVMLLYNCTGGHHGILEFSCAFAVPDYTGIWVFYFVL